VSRFVLDASIALAWFIDHPVDAYAVEVREKIERGDRAVVPSLWETEFANRVLTAERRKLMTTLEGDECIAEMDQLRLTSIEADSEFRNVRDVLALARAFQLTVYDACYLELAKRAGLPLATLDQSLRAAATKAGIRAMW
jgi:predicted nucleic acid-binding protein